MPGQFDPLFNGNGNFAGDDESWSFLSQSLDLAAETFVAFQVWEILSLFPCHNELKLEK